MLKDRLAGRRPGLVVRAHELDDVLRVAVTVVALVRSIRHIATLVPVAEVVLVTPR